MTVNLPILKTTLRLFVIIIIGFLSPKPNADAQSLWSDTTTWGGTLPVAGESVTIPSGQHILLDMDTPDLGILTIEGTLEFAAQNLNLTADMIIVMTGGLLQVGTAVNPFTHQAVITLNGTDTNIVGNRGIMAMGGTLELHGNPPAVAWTKINADAPAGSTSLILMESVSWNAGDEIAIAPTDYYDLNEVMITQKAALTSVSGTSIGIDAGLNAHRWGQLQYATNSGMSLTPGTITLPPNVSSMPTILDERAPIGNLTRNIVIQAPDDALWDSGNGYDYGCHVMVMRMGANQGVAHIDGIEIRRGGQNGILGRYPFHWHLLSYELISTNPPVHEYLADAIDGQYFRNSVVHSSANRGVVIHQTCGVEISNNVIYDVRGHAVFLEDSPERRNLMDGNLVMHVRTPTTPLRVHEGGQGPSGFWLSNPDNTVINNVVADSRNKGYWLSFPGIIEELGYFGHYPNRTTFGTFDNNTAHSNRMEGLFLERGESNLTGGFQSANYRSTTDETNATPPQSTWLRFGFTNFKTWKNGRRGIWDRSEWADNLEIVSADNASRFFAGAGRDGLIERCLVIGTSLNYNMNGIAYPSWAYEGAATAFATYHSTFDIRNNIIINFPLVPNEMSGLFATDDYYVRPVEKGQIRNYGNIMINTHPGYRDTAPYSYMTLAGAIWDPYGTWGTAGHWSVYDQPFFTYGQSPIPISPGAGTGAVYVEGPFYGFTNFSVNESNIYDDNMQIDVERLDDNFNVVGTWSVPEAAAGQPLDHQRHFAAHPSNHYHLDFPTLSDIHDVGVSVLNIHSATETIVFAVEYDGSYPIAQVYFTPRIDYLTPEYTVQGPSAHKHLYQAVANRDAVINSSGETYWQDTANDLVWVKIQGGLDPWWTPGSLPAHSDEELYRQKQLRITNLTNVLPIELNNFTAKITQEKTVKLTWQTQSETNNSHFEVERSVNGLDWEFLNKIEGNGTTIQTNHYQTFDKNPFANKTYYRLKQIDFDGKFTYSNIEIIEIENQNGILMFPNPVTDELNFSFENDFENLEIEIFTPTGKLIYFEKFENTYSGKLEIEDLPEGVYFLKMKTETGEESKRFFKIND